MTKGLGYSHKIQAKFQGIRNINWHALIYNKSTTIYPNLACNQET